jgi:hypothetical protein
MQRDKKIMHIDKAFIVKDKRDLFCIPTNFRVQNGVVNEDVKTCNPLLYTTPVSPPLKTRKKRE